MSMALVSYDSSDYSDSEEDELGSSVPAVDPNPIRTRVTSTSAKGFEVSREKSTENEDLSLSNHKTTTLFASLPNPRSAVHNLLPEEEDDFLTVTRPKILGSGVTKSKGSEPIKIIIPPLAKLSEEDDVSAKKPRRPGAGGGLFSVLPPPKHEPVKVTNRPLIPHSVNKKKAGEPKAKSLIKATASVSESSRCTMTSGDESDDGDDAGPVSADFFSLDNVRKTEATDEFVKNEEVVSTSSEHQLASYAEYQYDVPLEIGERWNSAGSSTSTVEHSGVVAPEEPSTSSTGNDTFENDQNPAAGSLSSLLSDEGFMRLHGKKRGKEDIEIIDVSQDDQLPKTEEWLTKILTQESEYRPSRKKGFFPTAQQRRKHQITYLAFQAKERELELKNQWSQNRFTRRQTQSKYGF